MSKKNSLEQILIAAEQTYQQDFNVTIISLKNDLFDLCTKISKAPSIAITVQGTNIDPMISACAGISIAHDNDTVYFIPRHNNEDIDSISLPDVVRSLQPIFADETIEKIFYNATFDQIVLEQHDMPVAGKIFDIQIAAQLIAGQDQESGIESLKNFYALHVSQNREHTPDSQDLQHQSAVIEACLQEHIINAHQTLFLYKLLQTELKKQGLIERFESIEMQVHKILIAMQTIGITCDHKIIKKIDTFASEQLEHLMYEINSYSQIPVYINNESQLRALLFDTLKLPGKRKLATLEKNEAKKAEQNHFDTKLQDLSDQHPVIPMIIRYQQFFDFKQNILDDLQRYIHHKTERIHAFWQQSMDKARAIFCTHPDLQNIPTDKFDYKLSIRSAFTAQQDYCLLAIDYHKTDDIKKTLINIHQQIQIFDAQIVIVTTDNIIVQVKDTALEKLHSLFPEAQTGKSWDKISS